MTDQRTFFKDQTCHPDFDETIHTQLLVVGGGVAGVVAAIAAAREGVRTLLMQNRPVLGGVSSSEYSDGSGKHVNGAYNYIHRNARECGIIEELKNWNAWHHENGYRSCWSMVLREAVDREENISLLMNTEALDVEMAQGRLQAVHARGINREINYTIHADYFIDASGDGFFACAGAEYRMGREGRDEFGESLAPEQPDAKTQGSSIAFRAVDTGHPVPFTPPHGALRFESDADLPFRNHSRLDGGYWWLEYGGELDTIHDNELIYEKLKDILFGLWDHVKNRGDHGADNYAISWIAPITGKRESRRFLGDFMLSQNDIMENREFPDAVAYGGWPIDIHPPEGIFAAGHPGSTPPFLFPPTYGIPFRSLYSRNIPNLLMAGRNISVSHVALGSTRVMATCAVCAQAVGSAVALLEKYHCTPQALFLEHLAELRALLQKNDQLLPERPVQVSDDLARNAQLSASSDFTLRMMSPTGSEPLTWQPKSDGDPCDVPSADRRKGQVFLLQTDVLNTIQLMLDNASGMTLPVTARLRKDVFGEDLKAVTVQVPPGKRVVVDFTFGLKLGQGSYAVILDPQEAVSVCTSDIHLPGFYRKADGCYLNFQNMVLNLLPEQRPYGIENIHNDYGRPSAEQPNIWVAEEGFPQTVTLVWPAPVAFDRLNLVFDTNLDECRFGRTSPECIREFEVEYEKDGGMVPLLSERDNCFRFRRFDFAQAVTTSKLVVKLLASRGDPYARLYGVHVYHRGATRKI
ncbi:MAG: FAD-dependent oxidoreductase [Victivallales bacterium]|nr:FAD-dependent oxidoreductase [Victivallales bacterium]